jgi:transcriptional regulator with XRE-family HTH domain
MYEVVQIVASNLKRLRGERGMSLSDLARRANMGKATLSNLEAARANPTIETLWALANALGVPFGDLIADGATNSVRVLRAREGTRVPGATGDARLVERFAARALVELYEMTLDPGRCYDAKPHGRGVVEHVFVVKGKLRTGPTGEPVDLARGDFARFPGDQDHVYEAIGGPAVALVVMDYP